MRGWIPDISCRLKEVRQAILPNSAAAGPVPEWQRRKSRLFPEENPHPDFWNQAGMNSSGRSGGLDDAIRKYIA